jgi:hypothetical protein
MSNNWICDAMLALIVCSCSGCKQPIMHDAHARSFLGITQQVDRLMRQAHRMERGLPANPLVPQLKDSLARWQVTSSAQ